MIGMETRDPGRIPWRGAASRQAVCGSHPMGDAVENALVDFLTAAVHLILHERAIYPREVFERRRLFDVSLYRSRHAELNEYVDLAMGGVRELLRRGEADALVLAVLAPPEAGSGGHPAVLERFRFELRVEPSGRQDGARAAERAEALCAQLRGFLLKLSFCESLLAPLPAGVERSFRLELHSLPARSSDPLPDPMRQGWVEADPKSELGAPSGQVAPLKSYMGGAPPPPAAATRGLSRIHGAAVPSRRLARRRTARAPPHHCPHRATAARARRRHRNPADARGRGGGRRWIAIRNNEPAI